MSIQSKCYSQTRTALRDGRLTRTGVCSNCGYVSEHKDIHPHHPDYSEPLSIVWLCVPCHIKWHRTNGPGKGADLSSLASRIAYWGVCSIYPASYVNALRAQIGQTGYFYGPHGLIRASHKLSKALGLRRSVVVSKVVTFEKVA